MSVVSSADAVEPYRRLGFEVHVVPEPSMPEMNRTLPPLVQRSRQLLARVQHNVIEPLPGQWETVRRVLQDAAVDVIVSDPLFLGASMLTSTPRASRPAVIVLGFSAPWIPDPLVPPYGMGISPTDVAANRIRAAAFELIAARALALLSRSFNDAVHRTFGVRLHEIGRASCRERV